MEGLPKGGHSSTRTFFFDLLTIFRCAFVFSIRPLMGDIHRTAGFGFGFGSGSDRGQYYFRRLKYARRAR